MDLINCPLSSFAVCADPNAARAKQQHQEKLYNWFNAVAQDHNKFASYNTALDRAATGLSRAYSDTNEAYLSAAGAIRMSSANNLREYLSSKDSGLSSEEGRSRNAGRKWLSKYLAEQGKLDAQLDQLGTSLFKGYRKSELEYKNYKSKAREQLGLPPLKPPPTAIPRKNHLTTIAAIGLRIGGAMATAGGSEVIGAGLTTAGSILPNY